VTAASLAADGPALEAFLAQDDAQVLRDHGTRARPDVVASFGLHRYAWPACLLFTVPWFLHGRVPHLPVGAVSVHGASGRMAVRPQGFTCLPGDPAARLPGARTVPSRAALREELRTALAAHAGPVLEGFRPLLRRGTHALWAMATDEVTESLWYVAGLLGEHEQRRARAGLTALLPGGTPPFAGAVDFREPPRAGEPVRRTRLTCCLFYTLDPAGACAGCPRAAVRGRMGRPGDAIARTALRSRSSQPF
jgi:hypothetical protein